MAPTAPTAPLPPVAGPAADAATPLLGFALVYPSWCSVEARPVAILHDLYVDPPARRRGIARALLQHVHAEARAAGAQRVTLATARTNHAAQRLYRALGYQRDDAFDVYVLPLA